MLKHSAEHGQTQNWLGEYDDLSDLNRNVKLKD